MLREDLIAKARRIARIDALEDGAFMDDDAILSAIMEMADENDRLENELAASRQRYADAFFNAPREEETDDAEEAEEEIKVEDFLDLD